MLWLTQLIVKKKLEEKKIAELDPATEALNVFTIGRATNRKYRQIVCRAYLDRAARQMAKPKISARR
jgi:hypothetical protein